MPGIGEALVQNKNCPAALLVPVVQHLSAVGIQSLLEDLSRVSDSLALASALEHSSSVTADQKNILHEMHGGTIDEAALAEAAAGCALDHAEHGGSDRYNKPAARECHVPRRAPDLQERRVVALASVWARYLRSEPM